MSTRAATPVIGIVLMVGFTIAAAMALFATGAVVLDDSQSTLEQDQAEESMVDVATAVDSTIAGPQERNEFSFEGAGDRSPVVEDAAGEVTIEHNGSTLYNGKIGALTFEQGTTEWAYQGGAVWRVEDNGETQMVRAPQAHYNFRTLTFPLVNITGDVTAGSQRGEIELGETNRIYPEDDDDNPLEGGSVSVEVESAEYCKGWETYFQTQADGELNEQCDEGTDDRVIIEFSVPLVLDGVDDTIRTGNYNQHPNADVDGEVNEDSNYDATSADQIIEQRRSDCADRPDNSSSMTITEGGLYCFDDSSDLELTVDTDSAGERVELYVNGSPGIEDIDVGSATSPNVDVYFDGSSGSTVETIGNAIIGNSADPSQTVLFFHSSTDFETSGTAEVYALLYAPESTVDVQSSGSGGVEGSIVAETVDVGSSSAEVEYSGDFSDFEREFDGSGEPFYYLHIVETEIVFEG